MCEFRDAGNKLCQFTGLTSLVNFVFEGHFPWLCQFSTWQIFYYRGTGERQPGCSNG